MFPSLRLTAIALALVPAAAFAQQNTTNRDPSVASPALTYASVPLVDVYKSEGCGCCEGWIKHLEQNGFRVNARNVPSTSEYRERLGMPKELGSCHTAVVQGYAVEGHVPATDIKRLLAQKPKAVGLAVPSMPLGSPGMEGPRRGPYDVFLATAGGKRSVYHHYDSK